MGREMERQIVHKYHFVAIVNRHLFEFRHVKPVVFYNFFITYHHFVRFSSTMARARFFFFFGFLVRFTV